MSVLLQITCYRMGQHDGTVNLNPSWTRVEFLLHVCVCGGTFVPCGVSSRFANFLPQFKNRLWTLWSCRGLRIYRVWMDVTEWEFTKITMQLENICIFIRQNVVVCTVTAVHIVAEWQKYTCNSCGVSMQPLVESGLLGMQVLHLWVPLMQVDLWSQSWPGSRCREKSRAYAFECPVPRNNASCCVAKTL